MKGVKYALAFVWGFLYGNAIRFISSSATAENKELLAFPLFFLIASTVILGTMSVTYLYKHWKED